VLQLRGRAFAAGGGADPLLVVVPLLCLVAGAAVALRVVPWVARRAEVRADRSAGLVLPLASWEVARRGHSTGAALLLVLATAAATFGTSLGATWATSAQDQADTAVGADLAVGRTAEAPLAQAAALAEATGGTAVPVTDRAVALGPVSGPGPATPETHLVAIDTRHDPSLVRGRLPSGTTWPGLTTGLGPDAPTAGIALPAGAGTVEVAVTGAVESQRGRTLPDLTVAPTVVVEAEGGARQTVTGAAVPLDGAAHAQVLPLPPGAALRVVAVDLRVEVGQQADVLALPTESRPLDVGVTLTPGAGAATAPSGGGWSAAVAAGDVDRLRTPDDVAVRQDGDATTVTGRVGLVAGSLVTGPAHLVLAGFAPPPDVPVLLGRDLAASIAAAPGDTYALALGDTTVVARVVGVAPPRAALPRGATILADQDALSRAVVAHGPISGVVDAWWLTDVDDPAATARLVEAAGLGEPVTRVALAAHLRDDPLRVGVQVALWLLVAAAGVLTVAGTVVQSAAALEARAVDVARLQGMGASRRAVVGTLLVEHGVVSVLVVLAGAAVGAVTAVVVGPRLVVSATGGVPVPVPVAVWPWPAQVAVVGVLLVACTAVVVPVATRLARRATVAHLRMEGGR
ncbi:FtsX-like permease family protein, partial [Cellulomonas sp. B6]|uniref:FtsX-like permease family protein n=1 Tax=Cellulomonas sp. B6 TaxID=1295626 RepID=UPI00350FBA01